MKCRGWLATPPGSGGVAIVELDGDVEQLLSAIAPPGPWPVGELKLREIAEVDTGLVVRLNDHHAQLTPHGGPRVVELIAQKITAAGASWLREPITDAYPEAQDEIEARALAAIAQANSPIAIKLLLEQPERWRNDSSPLSEADIARSQRLNRLIWPPLLAVIGPPNAGKSTLLNQLLGREAAIVSPHAGTTRDRIGALIDIGGLVVQWIDTPGQRESDDALEQEAIQLTRKAIDRADLRIRLIAPDTELQGDPHADVDLVVVNKADLDSAPALADQYGGLLISAKSGDGIEALLGRARDALVPPGDLLHAGRWDFPLRDGTAQFDPHE